MKIKPSAILLALIGAAVTPATSQSAVLTVDNNPGAVAMFTSFAAAYAAAELGDTILLAGSQTPYQVEGIIYKRIHVVGNGYFLTENAIPGLNHFSAKLHPTQALGGWITLGSHVTEGSAENSTFTGVDFVGYGSFAAHVPVMIDRCMVGRAVDYVTVNGSDRPAGPLTIRRSHVGILNFTSARSIVANSIIFNDAHFESGSSAANCVFAAAANVLGGSFASIVNSIFTRTPVSSVPTAAQFAANFRGSVTHSMAVTGSFLPEGNGNINGLENQSDVFVYAGQSGYTLDSYWQLKPGSPAIGAGFNGVDMGAFGGTTPYILSGVPSRPRVTRLTVPPIANSATGLRFEVVGQSF